jgi:hypothetical protein
MSRRVGAQTTQRRQDKWRLTTNPARSPHEWCSARLGIPFEDRAPKPTALQIVFRGHSVRFAISYPAKREILMQRPDNRGETRQANVFNSRATLALLHFP